MTSCKCEAREHRIVDRYWSPREDADGNANRRVRVGCLNCGAVWTQDEVGQYVERLEAIAPGDQRRMIEAMLRRRGRYS